MADSIVTRVKNAWNAFMNRDPPDTRGIMDLGNASYLRPDRPKLTKGNERSVVTSVINRIAMDCAAIDINHVQLDENNQFLDIVDSSLNRCLTLSANKDQTGRALIQDIVISMLDEGVVAIVPVDTTINPLKTDSYDILSLRVGKIEEWFPDWVRVNLYNDRTGIRESIKLPKASVAIVENPLYAVMNEPNSTLQRLMRKLVLLDIVDEQTGSNKLNMIVQLPYQVKTPLRIAQAEKRKRDLENQLANSKYGVAYIDATEKITQINRPLENNLLSQIEYLMKLEFSQIGITEGVLNNTATPQEMTNYMTRIIEPILSAIVDEMKRKFLTKTAITQKKSIEFFRDPFKLVPVEQVAEIGDKMTRNEILSSNEVRQIVGRKPVANAKADELSNKNLYPSGNNIGGQDSTQEIPSNDDYVEEE